MKDYLNKNSIISFILLITVLSMPIGFIPKKAKAQVYGDVSIGGAMSILPLCVDLDSSVTGIFNGIGSLFSSSSASNENSSTNAFGEDFFALDPDGIGLLSEDTGYDLEKKITQAQEELSVRVYDQNTETKLKEIADAVSLVKTDVKTLKNNDSCLDGIGKLLAKIVLQKITRSTIDWINSGFEGEPTFLKQPGVFFADIAENEILQFGAEITGISPFSKDWLKNQARAYNRKFADNATYSMNELMAQTTPYYKPADFHADFAKGGWDAWSYLTQVPANNPLGANLMFSNELGKRLVGTEQSYAQNVRDSLEQASGFLGDERCVDPVTGKPNGVTKSEYRAALRETPARILCPSNQWQYVTPGSMVARAATDLIGYPKDAFLDVDDLNDAVAAILDAMISHFASKWMSEGFANAGSGSYGLGSIYSGSGISYTTQTEEDFSSIHLTSSWLKSNPNFNIRTDLNQALIDEQRTYSNKLAEQNKELLSTTDGKDYKLNENTGLSNTYGLIPVIYQLDYCIPGPHPGWENDSRQILAAATDTILPETRDSLDGKSESEVAGMAKSIIPMAAAMVANSLITGATGGVLLGLVTVSATMLPVVGAVVGAVVAILANVVISLFESSDDSENVRIYYSNIMAVFTGYKPSTTNAGHQNVLNIESKTGIVNVLNRILDRYAVIIDQVFTPEILPSVTKDAAREFQKVKGYYQMMKNNEDKILSLRTTINILGEIKVEVDELNRKLSAKEITEEEYETALSAQINAFGRISSGMVNGNDIANADNILKQIIDKKIYIYNNLLKGPYGCEKELEIPKKYPLPYSIEGRNKKDDIYDQKFQENRWDKVNTAAVKRVTYPLPILYDYNNYKFTYVPGIQTTVTYPDPLNSGFINKAPNADALLEENQRSFYEYIIKKDQKSIPKIEFVNGILKIDLGEFTTKKEKNLFLGPGFLSFVYFSDPNNNDDVNNIGYHGPERLYLNDLVPLNIGDQQWVSVGLRSDIDDVNSSRSSSFETMIGIY